METNKHNIILEVQSGSHLYGTTTPESDNDYLGIFIPSKEYILGLESIEEYDLSSEDKLPSGRNTSKAVDRKFYELRHFCELALDNNPNILELLFVPQKNIVHCDQYGSAILNMKHLFPWKGAIDRFVKYARGQRELMMTKKRNYTDLYEALEITKTMRPEMTLRNIPVHPSVSPFQQHMDARGIVKSYSVANIKLNPYTNIFKVRTILEEAISKLGYRSKNYQELGFDPKFASHTIRLLLEGKQLIQDGLITFPLYEASAITDIKLGRLSLSEINEWADQLETEIQGMIRTTVLPDQPMRDKVNMCIISLLEDYIFNVRNTSKTGTIH